MKKIIALLGILLLGSLILPSKGLAEEESVAPDSLLYEAIDDRVGEILKEKGLLDAEGNKPPEKGVTYRSGEGFTFTSPDERYRLSLGAKAQFRFTHTQFEETKDRKGIENASTWTLPRAYLTLGGYAFTKDLTYGVTFNAAGSTYMLLDTWCNYLMMPELQGRGGQFVIPFGRQGLTSSFSQQFTDRSQVTAAFVPFYDDGVNIHGLLLGDKIYYAAGVYNGLGIGPSSARSTPHNAFDFRIELNPFGRMPGGYEESSFSTVQKAYLSLGGSYFTNVMLKSVNSLGQQVLESSDPPYASAVGWLGKGFKTANFAVKEDLSIRQVQGDLDFKAEQMSLRAEYFHGTAEGNASGEELEAEGWYFQAGAFVIPDRVEIAYRRGFVDPNLDVSDDQAVYDNAVVTYYFFKNLMKMQLEYGNIQQHNRTGETTDDQTYRFQAQVAF